MTDDARREPTAFPASPKTGSDAHDLATAIRRRLAPFGGVDDLEPHPPVPVGEPPDWPEHTSDGASQRGVGVVAQDEIDAEIAVHRMEAARRDGKEG